MGAGPASAAASPSSPSSVQRDGGATDPPLAADERAAATAAFALASAAAVDDTCSKIHTASLVRFTKRHSFRRMRTKSVRPTGVRRPRVLHSVWVLQKGDKKQLSAEDIYRPQ